MNKRTIRYALVAAVCGAMAMPLVSQLARAKDEAKAPADADAAAVPAAADETARPQGAQGAAPAAGGAEKPAAAPKVAPDAVVLTVGDEKITAAEFDGIISDLPPQYQALAQGSGRRMVADEIVKVKLLAAEAKKRGLDKDQKVQDQLAEIKRKVERQLRTINDQVLAGAVANAYAEGDAAKKYFEANPEKYGQVKARHILVSTRGSGDPLNPKKPMSDEQAKKKADDIRARLVKGEDFAAIAKAESDDPGSKETGGEYTFGRGQMVKEFEETAFGLKKGEISQPVKTQFGYHVIQLQERLPGKMDDAKQQIVRDAMESLVAELRKGTKTELNPDYFGAAPAPEKKTETGNATEPAAK